MDREYHLGRQSEMSPEVGCLRTLNGKNSEVSSKSQLGKIPSLDSSVGLLSRTTMGGGSQKYVEFGLSTYLQRPRESCASQR